MLSKEAMSVTRLMLTCLTALLAGLAIACGSAAKAPSVASTASLVSNSTPQSSERPTPEAQSATVSPVAVTRPECPVDGDVCAGAVSFENILNAGGAAVATAAKASHVTCMLQKMPDGTDPVCRAATDGAVVDGFPVGQKVMQFVDRDELAHTFDLWTALDNGKRLTYHVAAVGCPRAAVSGALDCGSFSAATYTANLGFPTPSEQAWRSSL